MTNADKIKQMTNDELGEFISQIAYCCEGRKCSHLCEDCPLAHVGACNKELITEWLSKTV